MDEGWEDVLPGLRACEDCRGLGSLEPVQDSVAGVLTGWYKDVDVGLDRKIGRGWTELNLEKFEVKEGRYRNLI